MIKLTITLKGCDVVMMAMFWAQNIINNNRSGCTYENTPALIKPQVAQILIDSGLGHLVTDK